MCIVLAMCSWVDAELPEEPQYQYPEQYEEGKYNMNNLSLLNTILYCI